MKHNCVQIQWTCATLDEARKIAHALVESRLVACANIIPRIESFFLWEDKVDHCEEVKVLFKTRADLFKHVKKFILDHTSYQVPEILQMPITDGNPSYLQWVLDVTAD